MTVLALDTSARRRIVCSLAEADGRLLRATVRHDADVDTTLPRALSGLLDGKLAAIVVVDGPGSYTGVRAGMAAGLGIAQARGLPLHAAGALEVVAAAAVAAGADAGWAVAAAGRGGLYAARFGLSDRDRAPAGPGGVFAWARIDLRLFDAEGAPVYSADELPVSGLRRVDPALGLAAVVPAALARPALQLESLRATYSP